MSWLGELLISSKTHMWRIFASVFIYLFIVTRFHKSETLLQVWLIFTSVNHLFPGWPTFSNVTYFYKCGQSFLNVTSFFYRCHPFFQLWTTFPNVTHFYNCELLLEMRDTLTCVARFSKSESPNFCKCAAFFREGRIFLRATLFLVCSIFPSVPHFSKCAA